MELDRVPEHDIGNSLAKRSAPTHTNLIDLYIGVAEMLRKRLNHPSADHSTLFGGGISLHSLQRMSVRDRSEPGVASGHHRRQTFLMPNGCHVSVEGLEFWRDSDYPNLGWDGYSRHPVDDKNWPVLHSRLFTVIIKDGFLRYPAMERTYSDLSYALFASVRTGKRKDMKKDSTDLRQFANHFRAGIIKTPDFMEVVRGLQPQSPFHDPIGRLMNDRIAGESWWDSYAKFIEFLSPIAGESNRYLSALKAEIPTWIPVSDLLAIYKKSQAETTEQGLAKLESFVGGLEQ